MNDGLFTPFTLNRPKDRLGEKFEIIGTLHPSTAKDRRIRKTRTAARSLDQLYEDADAGDPFAIGELTQMTISQTKRWELISKKYPDRVSSILSTGPVMPCLWMPHPNRTKEIQQRYKQLGVGSRNAFHWDAQTRWSYKDDATRAALLLVEYLDRIRWMDLRRIVKKFPQVRSQFPKWYLKAAELAPFSKKTVGEWWAVAKEALLNSYPNPEQVRELQSIVSANDSHWRETPGRHRRRILEFIQRRMVSIAKQS